MNRLGDALRAWRDRLDPAEAGLPHGVRRRVPGLRRAELALLAGISVEYVVRLEQGRVPTPSAQVCSALARALRLSDDEHAHLLRLAGHAAEPGRVPRVVPASLYRIMDQLSAQPVAVYDAIWQLCTGTRCSRPRSGRARWARPRTAMCSCGSSWRSCPGYGSRRRSGRRSRSP